MTSTDNAGRATTTAVVATQHGSRYMRRLCKHFAHKVSTTLGENNARLEMPFGVCEINVDAASMQFYIALDDPDKLGRAEQVITDHLLRMADRDEPEINWQRGSGSTD